MKALFCQVALLCLAVTAAHAQSADSLTGKLAGLPTRVFGKIESQSANLNRQISTQTQKYLARMARREQRMQQKMAAVDSDGAKAIFGQSQQQYAALAAEVRGDTGTRKVSLSGQYVPYADTLQGAMTFLKQYPQLLAKGTGAVNGSGLPGISLQVQAKLRGAATQFQAVQAKLQDADIVKAYVQSRQQQISQYIAQHTALAGTLGKSLAGMQQAQFYFSQRVQQFKAMLSDPGAMAQRALAMLGQLPAFQTFMSTHSQLGSLFHVPGGYGAAKGLSGLQTKEQVAQIVQKQIAASGPAGAAALQSNLQAAQSQLDGYKDKLSKLGLGNADGTMPPFTPNAEKTKTFLHRLQVGFNFQTTHNSYYYPNLVALGASLGYKLNGSNVIGVGVSYQMGTGNGIRDISFTSNGLGLRTFVTIKIKGSISATGGFEYNYTTPFTSYQQLKQIRYWQKSGLFGITKTVSLRSKVFKQTTLSLLWDAFSYQNAPPTQPFLFRLGYNL